MILRRLIEHRRRQRRARTTRPVKANEVAIVVLNWNRRDETLACLESLQRADLGGARIIVVDNASRDGSVEAVRERFPGVQLVTLPENRGYAGGNNAGIRAALDDGAEAVLLLNNDTVVAADFLQPLLDVMNHDPLCAAVSSAVMRADIPEVLDVAYLELYFGHGIVYRRGVNALPGEGFDFIRTVDVAVGSSLLLRSAALREVGLLDESYFAYHEDVDWCFRARRKGLLIYYQPYSRVWHHGSKSTVQGAVPRSSATLAKEQLPNAMPLPWNPTRTYLGARNTVRFMRRHGHWWQKLYFAASSLYAIGLETLAVVSDREEEYKLGLLTYRRALSAYRRQRSLQRAPDGERPLNAVLHAPADLLWHLPHDLRRLHRGGRTAQVVELVRGLWDGILDRPLPLERLGLR